MNQMKLNRYDDESLAACNYIHRLQLCLDELGAPQFVPVLDANRKIVYSDTTSDRLDWLHRRKIWQRAAKLLRTLSSADNEISACNHQ